MSEMIERVAKAIQAELRRQGKLYPFPPEEPDPAKLMMPTGECADLSAVVRAALLEIREPTGAMCGAGADADPSLKERHLTAEEERYGDVCAAGAIFTAMIDAALSETP